VRKNQTSSSAIGIAAIRAVESAKPEGVRICYDPLARRLIPALYWYLFRPFANTRYMESAGPGVMGFIVTRERHIDDYFASALASGLQQLVILGAGLDSRAYRSPQIVGRVKVFEVDHPATQQDKLTKLRQIFGRAPDHVTYVPVDFNQQSLSACLVESGYDECLKTLFIWQGVTPYLTPQAVDDTLGFAVCHSGPGSAIIFDYLYTWLLNDNSRREIRRMRRASRFTGEGLTFAIPEGTIEEFMTERGFAQVQNASSADLQRLYCVGVNAHRTVASGYAIVSAVVKS
jgi:methyltransferase (TIGR00027 family)